MTELLLKFGKMLAVLSPFLILTWYNTKINVRKLERYKQFLMPIFALIYCIIAVILLTRIYNWATDILFKVPAWFNGLEIWLGSIVPEKLKGITEWFGKISMAIQMFFVSLNIPFWAFYVANLLIMTVYLIVKKVCVLLMQWLCKTNSRLFLLIADLFYDEDAETGKWYVEKNYGQARTYLKVMYITTAVLGMIAVLASSYMYQNGLLMSPFYPVFGVIVVGECYFFLNGLTFKEMRHALNHEEDDAERVADYSAMRKVLSRLFKDRLNAENTTFSESMPVIATTDELLSKLEESDKVYEEAYGRFMRAKSEKGMELDRNYLLSGHQLLNGESMLFNNPFYYDLIPYIFYPMNRAMLRHKKVLIVLGRHGAEEQIAEWCREGLTEVTNVPSMWNIGVLTEKEQELDVGILTRSSVHNLKLHEANRTFFDETEFVVLIEPSRLLTTAQVGLNSIVRYCRRKEKSIVFCSTDKNCDGLVDALSHVLMTSLKEVSAMNHHKGASSYMLWEADSEHLQHRMLPNLSRYMGMGTELSFAALKNQVSETQWYGGDSFPVVDTHWIVKQYYYDLLGYANLPTEQEVVDQVFKVSPDMWSARVQKNQYITVEDESYNMFEIKRDFSTRAKEQGFINVISSEYLLKDYMAANDSIFDADPKAIPNITADYARTPRNIVLRLCLRMSTGLVPERDVRRELMLIDRDTSNPTESLWNEICVNLGNSQNDNGEAPRLYCHTADGDVEFNQDVIITKRRFSMDTGRMEKMYFITDQRFIRIVLGSLRAVEYIAEDENGQRQYIGTELQGMIFQKYLPGQFFTFSGKYYEMLRVTSDGQVLVRRAADHINGRPSYRQIRHYFLSKAVDSEIMGECRDLGNIRIFRQFADLRVETPSYYIMDRYNDFGKARKLSINGIPDRVYNKKAILRIDFNPEEPVSAETLHTLTLLINEVLRTLLAENQDYLVAVNAGEIALPMTYSLDGENGFRPETNSIYIIEDSALDIGLLDSVERNLNRIFSIICDYLQWHAEAMEESLNPPPAPEPVVFTPDPSAQTEKEPKGFFGKVWHGIKSFFKKIGAFFKKVWEKISALFSKKPKADTPDGAEPTVEKEPKQPWWKRRKKKPETAEEAEPTAQETEDSEGAEEIEPAEETAEEAEQEVSEEAEAQIDEEIASNEVQEPSEEDAIESDVSDADPEETEQEGEVRMSLFSTGRIIRANERPEELSETGDETSDSAVSDDNADNDAAQTDDEPEAEDALEFEPEDALKAMPAIERLPYHQRYFLRYGDENISSWLDLNGVGELLVVLGYDNNALKQARKGKNAAELVARTFVPNRAGSHYCDFCGCELMGMEHDVLADGRERCTACSRSAVKSLEEFTALHDAVIKNLKLFFGVKIPVSVNIQMVNSKKLHKKLGKTFVPSGDFDGRVLGVAIKDRNGYTILIENGAPKLQSTMTMVHEMTHIWQYLNWNDKEIRQKYGDELNLEVYEGMAKWVEIQYAYLLNETATAKREELITLYRNDAYGNGFKKYAEKYPLSMGRRNGVATPFDDVKSPL